ncbi:MAG: hypothetical protein EAX95_12610 [Candidatus Thorarchaeota archaeon]|nr:hypothetical protein [Candidatus Thorarchaeota archaeon]
MSLVAPRSSNQLRAFLLVILLVAGGMIIALVIMQPQVDDSPSLQVIGYSGSSMNVTLNEMKTMEPIEGDTSFQNSYDNQVGYGHYVGVNVSTFIELVGGIEEDQVVIINATDGYSQIFTYENVFPTPEEYILQGYMIIAYAYNSTEVPAWEDGFRLIFMPEDGYFNNSDAEATIDADFFSGAAGPKCVRNVATIQVADRPVEPIEPVEPIVFEVITNAGTTSFTWTEMLDLPTVTGEGGTKNRFGTLDGPFNFTGFSLHSLLTALASLPEEYNVSVVATDGYAVVYNHTLVEGTITGFDSTTGDSVGTIAATMIVAYERDGEPLLDDGPLRIAFVNDEGYLSNSSLWAKHVANVTLVIPSPPVLFLKMGAKEIGLSMGEILAMDSITGDGGYKRSSGTLVGPDTYTGVRLLDVLELLGELPANYTLEIVSSDEYTTYFNKTQVEGILPAYNTTTGALVGNAQFDVILAYERNGQPLYEDEKPFRIATLNDSYFSDGHFWAKMAVNLTVIDEVEPWIVELDGVEHWNMTHDIYYSLASCAHHRQVITAGGHEYWGVALYVLVAAMDGADTTHYVFNTTLLATNYNVTIYGESGANETFTCWQVTLNYSIIVAGWVDGQLIVDSNAPLVLVTPEGLLLGSLEKLELVGWQT